MYSSMSMNNASETSHELPKHFSRICVFLFQRMTIYNHFPLLHETQLVLPFLVIDFPFTLFAKSFYFSSPVVNGNMKHQ